MKIFLGYLILFLFSVLILTLSIRGVPGNPAENTLADPRWGEEGPLELSPERGRFALLMSIVEKGSFNFSLPLARFVTPDLGFKDGKYVSLFTPGLSVISIPGYLIGKYFRVSQLGTYAVVGFFSIANALLISFIAVKLKTGILPAVLSSLVFLFATPAFPYAVSYYQHHLSAFLILMSVYLLLSHKGVLPLFFIFLLFGLAIAVDLPNAFLMLPIILYSLIRVIFLQKTGGRTLLNIKIHGLFSSVAFILPVFLLLLFNYHSYGNYWTLSGTVSSVKAIDEKGNPASPESAKNEDSIKLSDPDRQEKSAFNFFQSRNMPKGFNVLLFSADRGLIVYSPVMLFALYGIWQLYKQNSSFLSPLISVIGITFLLYSMWGDPWGGWAFGSRYLIPAFALLSVFIALTLQSIKRQSLFLLLFLMITAYSLAVNTLGALTSNRNPPLPEILSLEKQTGKQEKYTFERNWDMIQTGLSKSFVYQTYLKGVISAYDYYRLITSVLIIFYAGLLFLYRLQNFRESAGFRKLYPGGKNRNLL